MNVVVATCALGAAVAVGERSMAEAAPVSAARSSGKLVADGSGNILADAKSAFAYARAHLMVSHDSQHHLVQGYSCNWERGTYMLGLWSYYAVSQDPEAKAYLQGWALNFDYKLCGENSTKKPHHHPGCPAPPPAHLSARRRLQGACEHDRLPCINEHNANNQLCGATYVEMYKAGLAPRTEATLADTKRVFAAEMAATSSTNFWSWLDASFMAMNTWSRLAEVTGDSQYYEKQWANFNAAMLLPANGDGLSKGTTFGFWNNTQHLFYRDDCYVHTEIYWGRGNGWAMGALVAAIQNGTHDPHRSKYVDIFKLHAAKLASIHSFDARGIYWHSSLLDPHAFPAPEMTATASFVYGLAFGINQGLLDRATYLPVVEGAWKFMSTTALQPNGLFGYCQPVGGSPQNNVNATSTSDFCVGQFLLAATQMHLLGTGIAQ